MADWGGISGVNAIGGFLGGFAETYGEASRQRALLEQHQQNQLFTTFLNLAAKNPTITTNPGFHNALKASGMDETRVAAMTGAYQLIAGMPEVQQAGQVQELMGDVGGNILSNLSAPERSVPAARNALQGAGMTGAGAMMAQPGAAMSAIRSVPEVPASAATKRERFNRLSPSEMAAAGFSTPTVQARQAELKHSGAAGTGMSAAEARAANLQQRELDRQQRRELAEGAPARAGAAARVKAGISREEALKAPAPPAELPMWFTRGGQRFAPETSMGDLRKRGIRVSTKHLDVMPSVAGVEGSLDELSALADKLWPSENPLENAANIAELRLKADPAINVLDSFEGRLAMMVRLFGERGATSEPDVKRGEKLTGQSKYYVTNKGIKETLGSTRGLIQRYKQGLGFSATARFDTGQEAPDLTRMERMGGGGPPSAAPVGAGPNAAAAGQAEVDDFQLLLGE